MTTRRDDPYIWVTWLSTVMAGEQSCLFRSWFAAQHQDYAKQPSDFDSVAWNVRHTALLHKTRESLEQDGWDVTVESQNAINWRHEATGATVAGKADLVSKRAGETVVYDCKTGRPKASHRVQVALYMLLLPADRGVIVYDRDRVEVPAEFVDRRFRAAVDQFIATLAAQAPAHKVASAQECRWCPITAADCPERVG